MNLIHIQQTFTDKDISSLSQSWTILKNYDLIKFADRVLIRSLREDSALRHFWTSRLNVDGNNYDFSQGESCLRTDLSWHIGLRDHSVHFISTIDKLLSSIKNENLLLTQIRSLHLLRNISTIESDSLMILKRCIMEVLHECFRTYHHEFTRDYEQAWEKFLSFVIKYLLEKDRKLVPPTKIIISPATNIDQTSMNR